MRRREAIVYPSFMAGAVNIIGLAALGVTLVVPWFRQLLINVGMIPVPGEGPSEATMDKGILLPALLLASHTAIGFLRVVALGTGSEGSKVRAEFYFPTDPGYRDTVCDRKKVIFTHMFVSGSYAGREWTGVGVGG